MSEKPEKPVNQIDDAYDYARSLGAGKYTDYEGEGTKLQVEGIPMSKEVPVQIERSIGEAGIHATDITINSGNTEGNTAELTIIPDTNIKTPDGYKSGSLYSVETNGSWVGKARVYRKAANGEEYERRIKTKTKSGLALAKKIAEVSAKEYKKAAKERAISIIEKDDL